jgi:AAA15 family ATPase/GTPase
MLIEFAVGNFRSFYQPVTLSMLATSLRDDPKLDENNIFRVGKLSLLRSAAIYGPNASGKSNLIRAMMFFRTLVRNSATKLQAGEKIDIERFALNVLSRNSPAYFQIVFLHEGKRYRYGFEVDNERIHSEWLYHTAQRETRLFVREADVFDVSATFKREAPISLQEKTRSNALFLSVMAQFNSPTAIALLSWFDVHFRGISGLSDESYAGFTMDRFEKDEIFRQRVRDMVQLADVGIQDISVKNIPLDHPNLPESVREMLKDIAKKEGKPENELLIKGVETLHPIFNGETQAGEESFDMNDESEGTQKFFALLGPLFHALENGGVLLIDELEARLHPMLTRELVQMFNSPSSNPHNAQLIFATHDASLLGECLLRRDQVWFTQKNRFGATELFSLAEMKERKDASYLKNYMNGQYGATPHIASLRPYVEQELQDATPTQA